MPEIQQVDCNWKQKRPKTCQFKVPEGAAWRRDPDSLGFNVAGTWINWGHPLCPSFSPGYLLGGLPV